MGKIFCDQIKVLDWSSELEAYLDDTVYIYRIAVDDNAEKIDEFLNYLSTDELVRAKKYKNKIDRDRFILGRIMLKKIASVILKKDFDLLNISFLANNKPVINKEMGFQFNLSHSGNYVVLAICRNWETGIDLEHCNADFKFEPILDYCMNKNEQVVIQQNPQPLNQFLTYWTRKESILKATGVGIMDKLDKISCLDGFNLIPDLLIGITSQWMIRTFYIDSDYIVSLAHDSNVNKLKFFNYQL